jgi:hypothetical protein
MEVTVAERQGSGREAVAERSRRQTLDRRDLMWRRGRAWATSARVSAKSKAHQDTPGRATRRERKVEVFTRGGLPAERWGAVSRGRSSDDPAEPSRRRSEGPKEPTAALYGALCPGAKYAQTSAACSGPHETLREPNWPMRCSRVKLGGEWNSRWHA